MNKKTKTQKKRLNYRNVNAKTEDGREFLAQILIDRNAVNSLLRDIEKYIHETCSSFNKRSVNDLQRILNKKVREINGIFSYSYNFDENLRVHEILILCGVYLVLYERLYSKRDISVHVAWQQPKQDEFIKGLYGVGNADGWISFVWETNRAIFIPLIIKSTMTSDKERKMFDSRLDVAKKRIREKAREFSLPETINVICTTPIAKEEDIKVDLAEFEKLLLSISSDRSMVGQAHFLMNKNGRLELVLLLSRLGGSVKEYKEIILAEDKDKLREYMVTILL